MAPGLTLNTIPCKGWQNNLQLANDTVELLVTLDVGPRILSFRWLDGTNLFKEFDDQLGRSGEAEWKIRGGHRLWTAPEDARSYVPDNGPVTWRRLDKPVPTVQIMAPPDQTHGIQKEMDLLLPLSGSRVTVTHRLRNVGRKSTILAPWALTAMAPGGLAIVPLPVKRLHPGTFHQASSPQEYWANQRLILWPFFDFTDPRLQLGRHFITLRHDPAISTPIKFGLEHVAGWVAYLNRGTLFVKWIPYQEDAGYPDHGCNFETFCNGDMLEIESLGPIQTLLPGQRVELTETWELFGNLPPATTAEDIARHIQPCLATEPAPEKD